MKMSKNETFYSANKMTASKQEMKHAMYKQKHQTTTPTRFSSISPISDENPTISSRK